MKINIHFVLSLVIIGCSAGDPENAKENISAEVAHNLSAAEADTIKKIPEDVQDSFPASGEIIVYPFYEAHLIRDHENSDLVRKIRFVPLTETYKWSEHPDSLAIENENLGEIEYEYDNYHLLEGQFRTRFLHRSGIQESDKIFVYNIVLDSIQTFTVSEIPIVAMITPYGAQGQVIQYDYLIGFELANCNMTGGYSNSFVYVGDLNPFNKGGVVPIFWKELKPEEIPSVVLNNFDSTDYSHLNKESLNTYYFEHKELEYFLQTIGDRNSDNTRYLTVIDSKTKEVVFSATYNDSEGASPLPLNRNGTTNNRGDLYQWTGQLFNNRPPVILGFLTMSFGCPRIDFLNDTMEPIFIKCDNRH